MKDIERALTTIFNNNAVSGTTCKESIPSSLHIEGVQKFKLKQEPTDIVREKKAFEGVSMDVYMCRSIFYNVLKKGCKRLILDTCDGRHYDMFPDSLFIRYMDSDEEGDFAIVEASATNLDYNAIIIVRSVELHSLDVLKEDEDDVKYLHGGTPYTKIGDIVRVDCNVYNKANNSDVLCFYYY
jgi:hypothetical protein